MDHADVLRSSPLLLRAARTARCLVALPAMLLRILWRVPAALGAMAALGVGVPLLTRAPRLQRRFVHRICRVLCAVLGLRIERDGAPCHGPALLAANHVSWLDTIGQEVAPLHPMLFETAVREGVPVQPVTLAYRTAEGAPSRAAAFIGDDTLLESLGRVLLQRELRTIVHWGAPFSAEDRRSFARGTRRRLARTLAAFDGAAPGSRAGQGRPAPSRSLNPAAVAPGPGTGAASTRTA